MSQGTISRGPAAPPPSVDLKPTSTKESVQMQGATPGQQVCNKVLTWGFNVHEVQFTPANFIWNYMYVPETDQNQLDASSIGLILAGSGTFI